LREHMQIELKDLHRQLGVTFVYVTHDQGEALTMSDRVAVFNEGRIEQVGPAAQVYEHPRTEFVAGFVGVSNLLTLDGHSLSVRPEKIRILDDGAQPEPGAHVESGKIREVVYAGMATRYIVELDDGGELTVVVQNLETTSAQALETRGRSVRLQWRQEHELTLETRGTKETE
jgi:putative spermidine/putrescine transport system ATP-binding protein